MTHFPHLLLTSGLLAALALGGTAQTVWGGFDNSRVVTNPAVFKTGIWNAPFRDVISAQGGQFADPTPELTAQWLEGVDVFYTSQLHADTGALSSAEKLALADWVAAGGTLIVTADVSAPAGYQTFTSAYGVVNYAHIASSFSTPIVEAHAITDGLSSFAGDNFTGFKVSSGNALELKAFRDPARLFAS